VNIVISLIGDICFIFEILARKRYPVAEMTSRSLQIALFGRSYHKPFAISLPLYSLIVINTASSPTLLSLVYAL